MEKNKTTADYLLWDEINKVIEHLFKEKEYSLLMTVALSSYLGLRHCELCQITWEDIIIEKSIKIKKNTGEIKTIPLTNQKLVEICRKVYYDNPKNKKPNNSVISNRLGESCSIQYINRKLKCLKYSCGLNINHLSIHTFRKSFGVQLYKLNMYYPNEILSELSEIFGHTTTRITLIYLGLLNDRSAGKTQLKLYESL